MMGVSVEVKRVQAMAGQTPARLGRRFGGVFGFRGAVARPRAQSVSPGEPFEGSLGPQVRDRLEQQRNVQRLFKQRVDAGGPRPLKLARLRRDDHDLDTGLAIYWAGRASGTPFRRSGAFWDW